MIIDDFNVIWLIIPLKTNTPLHINADAVLIFSIANSSKKKNTQAVPPEDEGLMPIEWIIKQHVKMASLICQLYRQFLTARKYTTPTKQYCSNFCGNLYSRWLLNICAEKQPSCPPYFRKAFKCLV